ncbi:hypothetical protein BU14_0144s0016 [Porphyra umbilicalis]|uniref:Uncharacterized protein n=1 Tax=Porphyra umbilicalis TaxID=2786 RepID=A0A1X6P9H9_PORUM|nr:hypothetical protein BU14_0144s0016 [Porphyra umbilicalis]|eukprot:OSX77551.1 hypothetical protein BU14_0144s0016 [Porphyra umbilicalis]
MVARPFPGAPCAPHSGGLRSAMSTNCGGQRQSRREEPRARAEGGRAGRVPAGGGGCVSGRCCRKVGRCGGGGGRRAARGGGGRDAARGGGARRAAAAGRGRFVGCRGLQVSRSGGGGEGSGRGGRGVARGGGGRGEREHRPNGQWHSARLPACYVFGTPDAAVPTASDVPYEQQHLRRMCHL